MYSRTLFSVGKSLLLRSASGRVGQHVNWSRSMNVAAQEAGSSSADKAPPPPAGTATATQSTETEDTQGRKRKRLPKRAPISNASPRQWCRPIGQDVIPAYDLALELLKADSAQIKVEAELLRTKIQAMEEKRTEAAAKQGEGALEAVIQLDDELETMRKKLKILEVQGEVNLPDVRWRVANAMRMFCFLIS